MLFLQPSFTTNVSPNAGNKTLRKLASLRNRSPTGDSPNSKTRKSTQAAGKFCLNSFFHTICSTLSLLVARTNSSLESTLCFRRNATNVSQVEKLEAEDAVSSDAAGWWQFVECSSCGYLSTGCNNWHTFGGVSERTYPYL